MAALQKIITSARASAKEVRDRFTEQDESRKVARNLLTPDEVAGDYDAGRLLMTTLGGSLRTLTREDLATFKRNAESLGKRFKGGITPKAVIDMSTAADRERSNKQIHVAVPTNRMGNLIHFTTNAGPLSNVARHHVQVALMNVDSAVASPSKAVDLAKMVASGAIKFDCDCDHHRYRFRYIATIGRYNAGRAEPAYPKLTNPSLSGVACKHVLRVMQQLASPLVRQYIAKMIDEGRRNLAPKLIATSKKDAQALAKHQASQVEWKRNTVESTSEKRLRLSQQRHVKALVEKANATMVKPTPAKMANAKKKFEQQARLLAQMGGISQKMLADMLAKLYGKK